MSKSSGSLTVPKKSVNMVFFSHMFVVVVVRFGHRSATGGHVPTVFAGFVQNPAKTVADDPQYSFSMAVKVNSFAVAVSSSMPH